MKGPPAGRPLRRTSSPLLWLDGNVLLDGDAPVRHFVVAEPQRQGFIREPAFEELEVIRVAKQAAGAAGPDRLGTDRSAAHLDYGALFRAPAEHELVGNVGRRIVGRGVASLSEAMR